MALKNYFVPNRSLSLDCRDKLPVTVNCVVLLCNLIIVSGATSKARRDVEKYYFDIQYFAIRRIRTYCVRSCSALL